MAEIIFYHPFDPLTTPNTVMAIECLEFKGLGF
jgi:hypothetical protein